MPRPDSGRSLGPNGPAYPLAPEHPFPAAFDSGVELYRWVLDQGVAPADLAVSGDSAGGGLVVSVLVAAREAGLPMPAACLSISPWADFTLQAGTLASNNESDPTVYLSRIARFKRDFLQGADDRDWRHSPVFADLSGLPPTLIQVGSIETLLDDARALHRTAQAVGVESTLEVWDDMVHVWHSFSHQLSEGEDALARVGEFLTAAWRAKAA